MNALCVHSAGVPCLLAMPSLHDIQSLRTDAAKSDVAEYSPKMSLFQSRFSPEGNRGCVGKKLPNLEREGRLWIRIPQGQVFVESLPHHAGYPKDNMNRVTNPCCFLAAQQHHFTVHLFFFLPLSAFEFETARRRPAAMPWKEGGKEGRREGEQRLRGKVFADLVVVVVVVIVVSARGTLQPPPSPSPAFRLLHFSPSPVPQQADAFICIPS